jgi:hypothetical protein
MSALLAQMRRVLFVGAGASATFDLPITRDILPCVVRHLYDSHLFHREGADRGENDRASLAEGLKVLDPGLRLEASEPISDLPAVTHVLSLLDFLIASGQPAKPRWDVGKLAHLRALLDRAICEVLWSRFEKSEADPGVWITEEPDEEAVRQFRSANPVWQNFRRYIENQIANSAGHLTIITTNYDLLLDTVLSDIVEDNGEPCLAQIDIGFVHRDVQGGHLVGRPIPTDNPNPAAGGRPIASRLALYKLHGSLNYVGCTSNP